MIELNIESLGYMLLGIFVVISFGIIFSGYSFFKNMQICAKCGKVMGHWVHNINIVNSDMILCDKHQTEYYAIIEGRYEQYLIKEKAKEDYLKSIGR